MNIIFRLIFVLFSFKFVSSTIRTQCYIKTGGVYDGHGATCDAGYTLVSCGIEPRVTPDESTTSGGSYMIDDACHVRSVGVPSAARCCQLKGNISCSSYRSDTSGGPAGAGYVNAFCRNDEVLTGCTVDAYGFVINGAFSVGSQCTAQHGGFIDDPDIGRNRYIFANARCCVSGNGYNLECDTIQSVAGTGIVSCPSGSFLSGCSARSSSSTSMPLSMWYIDHTTDECIALAEDSLAEAICCKESLSSNADAVNTVKLIGDGIRFDDAGYRMKDAFSIKTYGGNIGYNASPMTVVVCSVGGVIATFVILGLLAVVYCLMNRIHNVKHN